MRSLVPALAAALACLAALAPLPSRAVYAASMDDGRHLVLVAGCGNCHTQGYGAAGGRTPEQEWLTGSPVGYRGPWGTTYPANLRLHFAELDEDAWVRAAGTLKTRPPMPWYSVNALREEEARALHSFLRSLGPRGQKAPDFVPPGQEPATPFILMVPQQPKPAEAPAPSSGD